MIKMKSHEILQKYIEGIIKGYSNSLIVKSPAGFGKTETCIDTIKRLGYREGTHYRYISNYITPVELFLALEGVNNLESPKLLILDDCEETLRNDKAIGLLKGALWENDGKRRICWISGTHKVKNKEINFTGRIIFLVNYFNKKSPIVNALKDRSLFFEFGFTPTEIKDLITERAKQPYLTTSLAQRLKVAEFLTSIGKNLSLRSFPHCLNLMLLSPNHYKELFMKASVDN